MPRKAAAKPAKPARATRKTKAAKPVQTNPSIIAPGQSGSFYYVGNFIPNQVSVHNLNTKLYANYALASGDHSWRLFGDIPPGGTVSLLVQWPSSKATFYNRSASGVDIYVFGDGIFPDPPKS